jgi:hypothetical protein
MIVASKIVCSYVISSRQKQIIVIVVFSLLSSSCRLLQVLCRQISPSIEVARIAVLLM